MLDRPLPGTPMEEEATDTEQGAEPPERAADRLSSTRESENPETPIPYGG